MKITRLDLQNYRNHLKKSFEFDPGVNMIRGDNGSGKTNILEAIYMLAVGKSFRASAEREVINIDSQFARIIGHFDTDLALEIAMERSQTGRVRKIFKKNGTQKMAKDFVGLFKAVLFNPEDIRLVIGSPSRRRDYLDGFLSQISKDYYRSLSKYERILKHRNKILDAAQGQVIHNIYEAQLDIWDKQLVETGILVQSYRHNFFEYAKTHLESISERLFGENIVLHIDYNPNIINFNSLNFSRKKDLATGHTGVGPHRDDFDFRLSVKGKSLDLQGYGSRGQQRTAVLALKILELEYIESQSNQRPVLLLDDIFSELDEHFRSNIQNVISKYQTIISSAEDVHIKTNLVISL